MVAMCFLDCKSFASECFEYCVCWESHACINWDPFSPLFLYVGILCHIGSANLDSMAMVQASNFLSFWKLLPILKIFCVPPDRSWVFQPLFHWGETPLIVPALCRTSVPAPCLVRDESPDGISCPLKMITVQALPLGSAIWGPLGL